MNLNQCDINVIDDSHYSGGPLDGKPIDNFHDWKDDVHHRIVEGTDGTLHLYSRRSRLNSDRSGESWIIYLGPYTGDRNVSVTEIPYMRVEDRIQAPDFLETLVLPYIRQNARLSLVRFEMEIPKQTYMQVFHADTPNEKIVEFIEAVRTFRLKPEQSVSE